MRSTVHSNVLSLWTIYDHPSDYPDHYVARRFAVGLDDQPVATTEMMKAKTIEELREAFMDRGLVMIGRAPSDDPVIVETWL